MKQSLKKVEVVIVNNGSHDAARLRQLKTEFHGIHLVDAGGNIGYLPGANMGLKSWLTGSGAFPDAVILSNNDISFGDQKFLERYPDETRKSYDIIGPDIFSDLLHHHQNPFLEKRISLSRLRTLKLLSSNLVLHYLFLGYYYGKSKMLSILSKEWESTAQIRPVYGIHGSFMIFNRSFFEKGGHFDYPNPLYGEEIWLAEMALRLGLHIGYDPSLKVIHHEHSTTGMFKSRKLLRIMHQSYKYLIDHYHGDHE